MAIRFDGSQLARHSEPVAVTPVTVTRKITGVTDVQRLALLEERVSRLEAMLAVHAERKNSRAEYMREYRKIRAAEKCRS